ncbi:hypothetical protein [Microbacterium sp. NPDC089695]|uniref:hypothetical protein n=1 Tax=Microbacterium sp. NPDC089695 TaxID=3364198 RepID=UPI0038196946
MTALHDIRTPSATRSPRLTAIGAGLTLAIAAAVTLTLSGCTLASRGEPVTTPTEVAENTENTDPAEAAEAAEAAEQVYRSYTKAMNDVDFRDPTSWVLFGGLTSENMQVTDSAQLTFAHAHELTMFGEISIERFEVLDIRSDGSIAAMACLDTSTVAFEGATGATAPYGDVPDAQRVELRFIVEHRKLVLDAAITTPVADC